jgi:hypothetical protein
MKISEFKGEYKRNEQLTTTRLEKGAFEITAFFFKEIRIGKKTNERLKGQGKILQPSVQQNKNNSI